MKRTYILTTVLYLCVLFIFTTINVSAQVQVTTTTKNSAFQNLFSVPKNLFKKFFNINRAGGVSTPQVKIKEATTTINTEKSTITNKIKEVAKKESSLKKQAIGSSVSTVAAVNSLTQKSVPLVSSQREAKLKLEVASGGNVFSKESGISCYSNETCNKTFSVPTKIKLQAIALSGYMFKGWSEAQCGKSTECTLTIQEDTTVYAYFEVMKPEKKTATILYPAPGETCYIPMGEDKCISMLIWKSNTGLDMTIKVDYDEYYVTVEDKDKFPRLSGASPEDIGKAEKEKADGLVYFPLFAGAHKITLLHKNQELDDVSFEVRCSPGLIWDGTKCWEKNAKRLFVFKDQNIAIVSEPSGIKCGYKPEVCTLGFSNNSKVVLRAIPKDGSVFEGWTGDCSSKELTCTVIMDGEKRVGIKTR